MKRMYTVTHTQHNSVNPNILGFYNSIYVIASSFQEAVDKVQPTLPAEASITAVQVAGPYIP